MLLDANLVHQDKCDMLLYPRWEQIFVLFPSQREILLIETSHRIHSSSFPCDNPKTFSIWNPRIIADNWPINQYQLIPHDILLIALLCQLGFVSLINDSWSYISPEFVPYHILEYPCFVPMVYPATSFSVLGNPVEVIVSHAYYIRPIFRVLIVRNFISINKSNRFHESV